MTNELRGFVRDLIRLIQDKYNDTLSKSGNGSDNDPVHVRAEFCLL